MKIAVCMKQVPAVSEGNMDEKTGLLIRSGLGTTTNIYDLAALEAALQIREQIGGEIHVFTMGPQKSEAVLRDAFAMGADEGYLICDKAFAGADVLATSYTLMQAIKSVGDFALILCGRQTTDGDTAQVSGALAKWLERPNVNWVTEIVDVSTDKVEVWYNMDKRMVRAEVDFPCLLAVEKDSFLPRMPSLKRKISGKKKAIHTLTLDAFQDQDAGHYGLHGSATKVKRIFPPAMTKRQEIAYIDADAAVRYMLQILPSREQEEQR